jgi:DNA-binding response OmpR family regulator
VNGVAFILVIEDEPTMSRAVARMLRADGHDVSEARDGREGIRLLMAQHPDIVMTDIVMPNADGLEVIVANRAAPHRAKLIAMTGAQALGGPDHLKIARELGADFVLRKPFRLSDLQAAVASCRKERSSALGYA